MNYLSNTVIKNKRVILRVDYNVPIKDGIIKDNNKIIKSLDTIKYLLDNGNKLIILSHFGRIKTEDDKINNSLHLVYEELKNYIDVEFASDPLNITLSDKNCILVENTRFADLNDKSESKNNLELAKYWASFGDVFINDAFATLHRVHASTCGISNYLPTYYGFLVENEIKNLDCVVNNINHPYLVIMGGAKVDDKIEYIENILNYCDKLLITGGILNTFLLAKGYNVGQSLVSNDNDIINKVKELINIYGNKIIYSDSFLVLNNKEVKNKKVEEINNDDIIYDNGIDITKYKNYKTIFINGTCGFMDDEKFTNGTKKLLEDISNLDLIKVAGGGDAVEAVKRFGFENDFSYLSTGGGASLEYISNHELDGIRYINDQNNAKKQ